MEEEKEINYLRKIYRSEFVSGFLKLPKAGTKSDFERICGFERHNNEFRKWIDSLIKEGILKQNGIANNKKPLWTASAKAIRKKVLSIPDYQKNRKLDEDIIVYNEI